MALPKPVPSSGGTGLQIGTENFLRLKDRQEVKGIFRGQPLIIYQKWPKGGRKETFLTPEPGTKPRYLMNVVIHDGQKFVSKVFEMAGATYEILFKIAEHIPLEKTKIVIARIGSDTATKYSLIALAHEPLSPAQLAEIDSVQLQPLGIPGERGESDLMGTSNSDDGGSTPF